MPRDRLHKILQDLRAELETTEALNEVDKSLLAGVVDNIRSAIEEDGSEDSPDGSILNVLDDAALHFESEHPRLTKALFQISEVLRSAGLS